MAFVEDLEVFFSEDDFAVSATFTPDGGSARTVSGIFDAEYVAVDGIGEVAVSALIPIPYFSSTNYPLPSCE